MDFSNLEKLDVSGKTAKMYISELGDDAYLELRVADESNLPWYNAILERAALIAAKTKDKRRYKVVEQAIDKDELVANRERDAELFPMYIIIGWGGITNAAGENPDWSVENAQYLVKSLCKNCPRLFDEVRAFAQRVNNFMEEDVVEIDPAPLVGNSKSDSSGT